MICLQAMARNWRFRLAFLCAVIAGGRVLADSAEDWSHMKGIVPRGYVCYRADDPPRIDGRLDDGAWKLAPWTEDFVDIEGDRRPRPRFRTRAKMLWDADNFYIAVELEEPHVWGKLTKHDSVIFNDNDFEFFIDPDGDNHEYYEFEINALNTWDLPPRPYKTAVGPTTTGKFPAYHSSRRCRHAERPVGSRHRLTVETPCRGGLCGIRSSAQSAAGRRSMAGNFACRMAASNRGGQALEWS